MPTGLVSTSSQVARQPLAFRVAFLKPEDHREAGPIRCPLCAANSSADACTHCGAGITRSLQLLERLRAIAKNYPSLELDEITMNSPWPPGGDSLTAVEVMLDLERELGVQMPADAVDRLDTVGEAIRYFERHLPGDRT